MKHIDFYFDFLSPDAYLAFELLPQVLINLNYHIIYRPVLFEAQINTSLIHTKNKTFDKLSIKIAAKRLLSIALATKLTQLQSENYIKNSINRATAEQIFHFIWFHYEINHLNNQPSDIVLNHISKNHLKSHLNRSLHNQKHRLKNSHLLYKLNKKDFFDDQIKSDEDNLEIDYFKKSNIDIDLYPILDENQWQPLLKSLNVQFLNYYKFHYSKENKDENKNENEHLKYNLTNNLKAIETPLNTILNDSKSLSKFIAEKQSSVVINEQNGRLLGINHPTFVIDKQAFFGLKMLPRLRAYLEKPLFNPAIFQKRKIIEKSINL